jgi:hypothetical protein
MSEKEKAEDVLKQIEELYGEGYKYLPITKKQNLISIYYEGRLSGLKIAFNEVRNNGAPS